MFSKLVLFILVALLALPVVAQRDDQYLGGPWGKTKLSSEERLALQKAREKLEEAKKHDPSRASEAFKELRDLMREISGQPKMPLPVYDGSGVPYEGKRGQESNPKIVTDTVRLSDGFGSLGLNAQRGRGRLPVVPSSSNDIHVLGIVPIVTDSTQAVPTYGAWINRELDQLNIQSSDASDTRLVQVSFMVQ